MVMKKCSVCGYEAIDEVMFCGKCGNRFSERKCAKCGIFFSNELSFCPNCGAKVDAIEKKETLVNKTKNQEIMKKVFSIVSLVLLFSSLIIILVSLSLNWISLGINQASYGYTSGSTFSRTIVWIFGIDDRRSIGTSLYTSLFTGIEILKTVSQGSFIPENSASTMLLVIVFFITFIIQLSIFIIFLVTLIKSIVLVTKNKPFSKLVIKAYGVMIALYVIGIVLIGDVTSAPLMGLFYCVIVEVALKIFDYLLAPKKTNIIKLVPNIVGTSLLFVSMFFLANLGKISYPESSYFFITSFTSYNGIQKNILDFLGIIQAYRYSAYIDNQLLIVTIINLIFTITSAIFLGLYLTKRFGSTLDKVKSSTKTLGWDLIGVLLALYTTNIILGKNYLRIEDSNASATYGMALVVIIFVLLTQIADLINIGPKHEQVELFPKEEKKTY
jgi:hypothetical protein